MTLQNKTEKAIDDLLLNLEQLPGIGPKSASRIAYYLLNEKGDGAINLAHSIENVKNTVHFCKNCFNYSVDELCDVCSNASRNHKQICVVPKPKNIPPIERSGAYSGIYHVLGGQLSPMDGIGPDDIRISELLKRLSKEDVDEVIIATDPNIEGETTAHYIANKIADFDIKISRLAQGIPYGGELEFTDEMTLAKSIDDRRDFI